MKNLKTYNQLYESISDRLYITDKIEAIFKKYDFDYMFVGWDTNHIIIDELIKKNNIINANGSIGSTYDISRFDLPLSKISSEVIDLLVEWYDEITLSYLLEASRFNVDNIIKILKVERENLEHLEKYFVKDILESLNDEDELENKELQELFISNNFIESFFEIAYKYKLKNYIKDEYSEIWKFVIKKNTVKKFKI